MRTRVAEADLNVAMMYFFTLAIQLIPRHWEIPLEIQEAALVRAVARASVTTCDASESVQRSECSGRRDPTP